MQARPGLTASASLTVGEGDTAPAAGSGDVAVLATPRLLALCEEATVAAVRSRLAPGETTVGTRVELDHLAPSPPGAQVEATAVLTTVQGARLTFAVTARQAGRVVGRGIIERAVVDRARFLAGAERPAAGTPPTGLRARRASRPKEAPRAGWAPRDPARPPSGG